jgi:Ring hydroxylating beta subunit
MPAWLDEYECTSDPATQVSLICHEMRWEIEERIDRLKSRKSVTTMPLPRTLHVIGGALMTECSKSPLKVRSCPPRDQPGCPLRRCRGSRPSPPMYAQRQAEYQTAVGASDADPDRFQASLVTNRKASPIENSSQNATRMVVTF